MSVKAALSSHKRIADQADATTRERVLDRAAELFWTKGYASTTTREIAASLGIRQASLYHHFASKDDLLGKLCVSSVEELIRSVSSAISESDGPEARLRILMSAHLDTLLKYQTRHALMLTELRALKGVWRERVLQLRKQYAKLVCGVLEAGQHSGFLRSDIPSKYLTLALLNILNRAVLWFRSDEALTPEQLADLFARIYVDGAASSAARAVVPLPNLRPEPAPRRRKARASQEPVMTRLLDTAAVLFAKQSYALTSTREIAAQVGIQKASLYYHIETKEDLLYEICKSAIQQIRTDSEAALERASNPLERTGVLIRAHIESLLLAHDRHLAALADMSSLSEARLAEVTALRDDYEALVRSVLEQAQLSGALRQDVPVKYLCLALLGLLNRVLVWFRPAGPLSPGQIGALFANIYVTGAASVG
jgi:AcrR family transcriptional regulator